MPDETRPALAVVRARLVRAVEALVFVAFTSFTVTMLVEVFNRFVLNESLVEAEEFSRYCLVWMTLLAAPLVTAERGHLNGSLLGFIDSPAARWLEAFAVKAGVLAFAGCLGFATWSLIEQTISRTPALGINLGFVYASMLVGSIIDVAVVLLDWAIGGEPAKQVEYME